MRTSCLILALALAVGSLGGCGEGSPADITDTTAKHVEATTKDAKAPQDLQRLRLTTAGWEGPVDAGVLMAEERGYFADAGLRAEILVPFEPTRPVEYVVNGMDDLGVSHMPQVVLAKEKGAPIVVVGSLIPQPTAAMIWLRKSKIRDLADLKGKTIGIEGLPFQEEFLRVVLAKAGLTLADVKVRRSEYQLAPDLVKGRADAIFGGSWNLEGARLESRGLEPVITPVQDLGIPAYDEFVVIARADRASKDPQLIRGFRSALARGTAAAVEDPEGAVDEIEAANETNPSLNRKATEAEVEATLPLLSRSGYVSPERTRRLVDWMYEQGMIRRKPPVGMLLAGAALESDR